ncbi:hypothetical protein [Sphingomonas bisphenolicum]|uniref:Uncharacterized protein n=1 Tax=Sphingomonas bisphenolicum TaxID=296544 RepID=A0ABN5WIU0_9SPHN|nr:hypothetical protein [Sphingomonas bisphenolicum]BBF72216.1 hypothetical protein SBA_ch2_7490 [Sphingomonas bisphenolicum]
MTPWSIDRMMRTARSALGALAYAMLAPASLGAAEPAPFELPGPALDILVMRGDQSLPIAQVPSLSEGDRLSIEADLPADQGARFILVSAFLRGATNPPPRDWVRFAETWKKKDKDKALVLTVPKGARQMVLFLVPDTGGAEGVLSDVVRGKPGEFVRATQDLNQASLDRSRLDAFMAAIKAQENSHPEYLRSVAPTLARSLAMKLNEDCLSKVVEMQAACLLDNREALVLADVHSSSIAETLTGAPTDLALQLAATREAGYGFYSPYIGVVRDIAKIFGAFSSPQFDYLPTLSVREPEGMALLLNAAPSFQKPKSVMVVAMPAIEADSPPRLRRSGDAPVCAARAGTVLPVEGAPLIFSTSYAREVKLALKTASGETIELPLEARADRGGYVLTGGDLPPAFKGTVEGHLYGRWGFDRFEGPDFTLQMPDAGGWAVEGDTAALVVGRDNGLVLKGGAPACVESVMMRQGDGALRPVEWKVQGRDALALTVPLADRKPGAMRIEVKYQGVAQPAAIALRSYAQASRLDGLLLHAGDKAALLSGQRLDQVDSVDVNGLLLRPDGLVRDGEVDRLRLVAQGDGVAADAGSEAMARVKLRDGRSVNLALTVAAARPQIGLLSKDISLGAPPANGKALALGGDNLLPDNGQLVFSVRAGEGTKLSASDAIEVAPVADGAPIRLTAANGLRLESAKVMVATLNPRAMAPSLFGPLRFRLLRGGEASDWQPLVTLARLPQIEAVACEAKADGCTITGRDLFLIDAVGATPMLDQAAQVAHGYTGSALKAPTPRDGKLYLRLRDAPDSVVTLPAA